MITNDGRPICSTHGCYLRPHVSNTVYVLLIACLCLLVVDLLDLDKRLFIRFFGLLSAALLAQLLLFLACHLLLLCSTVFCSSVAKSAAEQLLHIMKVVAVLAAE